MVDMTDEYAPLLFPHDQLDDGAGYLYLRADIIYALARGVPHYRVIEALLSCQTEPAFLDAMQIACVSTEGEPVK